MIFVTGAARSGTTLTTGVLQACGAELGDCTKLLEHKGVKAIIKEELSKGGFDPMGQHPLPNRTLQPKDLRNRAGEAMADADTVKEAKFLLMWQAFHEAFPEAKWVVVRRDPAQIEESCKRTKFMKKAPDWTAWVREHERLMRELQSAVDHIEVWPDPDKPENFVDMVDYAGLEWNGSAVKGWVDPAQWH